MPNSTGRHTRTTTADAEAIALQALAFLAEDETRLARFLTASGLHPTQLRAQAGTTELSLAVLEHLATDESLLLVFSTTSGVAPESIAPAIATLQAANP